MESLLTPTTLPTELSFVKSHLATLSTLKQKYPPSHVPAVADYPKRATLANVPVCEPPPPIDPSASAPSATITLTFKSLKPSLVFTLPSSPNASIASLKALLHSTHAASGAPLPEEQRWILKGKAMGDAKLLKEFDVKEGSVVNLMIKPSVAPPPVAAAAEPMELDEPPVLTLSTPTASSPKGKPLLSVQTTPVHHATPMENPKLWSDALVLLKGYCNDEEEAKEVWESWFDAVVRGGKIAPGEKARIREIVGVSVMGGL